MTRSAFLEELAVSGVLAESDLHRLLRTAPPGVNEGEPLPQDLAMFAPLDISSPEEGEGRMCPMCGTTWALPPKEE